MKVDVLGVQIDNVDKTEAIKQIADFVDSNRPHYVVTPYSEMIVFATNDSEYKKFLNSADLSLPDGIGILWAAKYLHAKVSLLGSLLSIIFNRNSLKTVIREQVMGSRFIYDIASLAEERNFSLALVGGTDNVAAQSAYELKKLYPNLKVNLALSGFPAFNAQIVKEIADSNSDILILAYSPPKQEAWIAQNLPNLNVKAAIGLGGTFDYLAKKHPAPPQIWHSLGLSWLWRLITQPRRAKRIWNAVPVFIWKVYKYKHNHHA